MEMQNRSDCIEALNRGSATRIAEGIAQEDEVARAKTFYSTPHLTVYGSVEPLTLQAGGGMSSSLDCTDSNCT